ncbi:MAG: tyrosine-type recombinase/integrase [Gammaproteobacteria bacterium]|nr:tyrosine-type recombinase/integrase [Gammaproteobacteria bacterium]
MKLKDMECRTAQPGEKLRKLSDGGGLFLWVQPDGKRYWRLAYRFGGKQKTLALGVYPEVSLKEARDKRELNRKLLAEGIDPSERRKQDNRTQKQRTENTFEALAREWWEYQKAKWKPDHAARVMKYLEGDAFPALGSRPITEIETPDVLDVVRRIEQRGALYPAEDVKGWCSNVFRYAIQTGRARYNPAAELAGALQAKEDRRRPSLPKAELPSFLAKLEAYKGELSTVLALKLIVLTFVRNGELRGARWQEIDFDKKEWLIPAERMKMKEAHIVPLSRQAVEILEQMRPLTGRYELVFPSRLDRAKPISENTLNKALALMGYKDKATANGFRATASSILNEQGFNPDAIERQLAHKERNKVRAAYTHQAQYLQDRHRMMQWWADHLDTARAMGQGGNVVILPRRQG